MQNEDALIQSWLDSGKIGELIRKGRTIYYANLEPLHMGITVEGASRFDVARKLMSAHSGQSKDMPDFIKPSTAL